MKMSNQIAKEAIENFNAMTSRMAALANGNGPWSEDWPDEEIVFSPLADFTKKNKELKKELEQLS